MNDKGRTNKTCRLQQHYQVKFNPAIRMQPRIINIIFNSATLIKYSDRLLSLQCSACRAGVAAK